MNPDYPLRFTPMTLEDIEVVSVLEEQCFTSPWPAESYQNELSNNRFCAYWVARPDSAQEKNKLPEILAYGGYWLMSGEMHIVTIATHPTQRQQGIGAWFLQKMMLEARNAGAKEATLEVRTSNHAAIALYTKFGFVEVGRRKRYYRDNGEDALILTLHNLANWTPSI